MGLETEDGDAARARGLDWSNRSDARVTKAWKMTCDKMQRR